MLDNKLNIVSVIFNRTLYMPMMDQEVTRSKLTVSLKK